jgi:hypothetical protein
MVENNFTTKLWGFVEKAVWVIEFGKWAGGEKNNGGVDGKLWYSVDAFVALVTPLDSILEGLRVQTRGLFCFTAGGSRAAANSLNKE